jgi:hypothetical protein
VDGTFRRIEMPERQEKVKQQAKTIGRMGNSDEFADALGYLAEAEESELGEAQQDPQGFLTRRRVDIPQGASVTLEAESPLRLTVCINRFCVSWTF